MSMVCIATGEDAEVHHVLMPETMWMSVVHAITRNDVEAHDGAHTDCKEQSSHFGSEIGDNTCII